MKATYLRLLCHILLLALAALGLAISQAQAHPPLTAFGKGKKAALGTRPVLIILADTAPPDATPTVDVLAHAPSYYLDRVSGANFPSVSGFLLENSLGRFGFSTVELVDMIDRPGHDGMDFTAAERTNWIVPATESAQSRDSRVYGDTINAASRSGHNFAKYDTNNSGVIESHELMLVIVLNDDNSDNGAARYANPGGSGAPIFTIHGTSKKFDTLVCSVSHVVSFATLAHELLHQIGLLDLYLNGLNGAHNYRQTLGGATISTPNNPASYHLDPWHKLQFGWCDPQIMDMQNGGLANLQANQGTSTNKHLILYDSARVQAGDTFVREFFLLEYRTRSSGGLQGYDGQTNDNGLVVWHIHYDAHGNRAQVPNPHITDDVDPKTAGFQLHQIPSVFTLAPPSFAVGGGPNGPPDLGGAWHSGTTTPKLPWTIYPVGDTQNFKPAILPRPS